MMDELELLTGRVAGRALEAECCVFLTTAQSVRDIWASVEAEPATTAVLQLGIYCLRLFAQSLWTGPEGEVAPLWSADQVSLAAELAVDGYVVEELLQVPGALWLGLKIMRMLCAQPGVTAYRTEHIWRARAAMMLQRSLVGGITQSESPSLRAEVFGSMKHWAQLAGCEAFLQAYPAYDASLLKVAEDVPISAAVPTGIRDHFILELCSIFSMFSLSEEYKAALEQCEGWKMKSRLSGRMGIKRAHQQDAVAQLVVEVENDGTDAPPTDQVVVPRPIDLSELDQTTDMLEKVKLVDSDPLLAPTTLSEQVYVLAWANQKMVSSSVNDELAMMVVTSMAKSILDQSDSKGDLMDENGEVKLTQYGSDWAVWSAALWLRSRAEFGRSKWKERSCLQMLALEEQLGKQKEPDADARLKSLWLTDLPNKWEIRREVGKKFRSIGAVLTARDMYVKMKMWTEAAECLIIADRRNEARDLIADQLSHQEPTCVLRLLQAELEESSNPEKAIEHYEESWKLSGYKYVRAANALGRLHMKRNNLDDACLWLGRAVEVQPFQPKTQFTYGCLLMQREQHHKALAAFGRVVAHDEEEYEAWANMGAIHTRLNQWKSAKDCLRRAAELARTSWRVWDSFTKVCFKLEDTLGAVHGLQKMIECDAADQISLWMLHAVVVKAIEQSKDVTEAVPAEVTPDSTEQLLLKNVFVLFSSYFAKQSLPLPSQLHSAQNAFAREPARVCVDRYRIWCLLTEAIPALEAESLEICLKGGRHLLRVIEDCLLKESPAAFRSEYSSYEGLVEGLLKLWARFVNELNRYPPTADTRRFVGTSNQRIAELLRSSTLIDASLRAQIRDNFLSSF